MRKNALSLLVAFGFLLALNSQSFGNTLPLFGPKKYQRTTGKPDVYSDMVEVCNSGASYKIVVENGEAGAKRVSSGTIMLNGTEIVTQNEFNQQVGKIEKPVSLSEENTIQVKLASIPGSFINVSLVCTANCLDVKISSPTDQGTINKSRTIVSGDLYNAFGETGITIKSAGQYGEALSQAQRSGTYFAGLAPLQAGVNTLTATATDACGQKAIDTVKVNTTPVEERLRLSVTPASGVLSPSGSFQASFEADASLPNPVASYSWDFNDDGYSDQSGSDSDLSRVTNDYTAAGLYFPRVTVTDTAGNSYTEMAVVNVMLREEMDTIFKGNWDGMKNGLLSANIDKTLRFFTDGSKERYKGIFETLKNQISSLATEMGPIQLIYVKDGVAKYRIRKNDSNGEVTYYIYFEADQDGIWKISQF